MKEQLKTHDFVEASTESGIDAACDAVAALPQGQQAWGEKEYLIARVAAREAIAAFKKLSPHISLPLSKYCLVCVIFFINGLQLGLALGRH